MGYFVWFGAMAGSNPVEVVCFPDTFEGSDYTSDYFMECDESDLAWDSTIVMDGYTMDQVSTVVANTEGGSCA